VTDELGWEIPGVPREVRPDFDGTLAADAQLTQDGTAPVAGSAGSGRQTRGRGPAAGRASRPKASASALADSSAGAFALPPDRFPADSFPPDGLVPTAPTPSSEGASSSATAVRPQGASPTASEAASLAPGPLPAGGPLPPGSPGEALAYLGAALDYLAHFGCGVMDGRAAG
jgi:hypothetical protein